MDEYNIHMFREDLTEEFHALAQTYTMMIGTLLLEFTDDQLLLTIEMDGYECERLLIENDTTTSTKGTKEVFPENAIQGLEEPKNEDPMHQEHEHEPKDLAQQHVEQEAALDEPA